MKKIISVFLAVTLGLSIFCFSARAENREQSVTFDTVVLASLKLYLAGLNEKSEEYDFNSDGVITTLDLSILKLILAGSENFIPTLSSTKKGYLIEEKCGVTYIDGILMVNKTYSLPKDYSPSSLTKECERAFDEMKKAALKDGVIVWVSSGYRSYETQKALYQKYCKNDGVLLADTYSARPGHSEHQTGLSIDVNSASSIDYETIYKKVGEWLENNCHHYGFIIRYPKGKEHITGYIHEPWHIRYVGKDYAIKIKESGLCLEEYWGVDSKYAKE